MACQPFPAFERLHRGKAEDRAGFRLVAKLPDLYGGRHPDAVLGLRPLLGLHPPARQNSPSLLGDAVGGLLSTRLLPFAMATSHSCPPRPKPPPLTGLGLLRPPSLLMRSLSA